MIIQSPPRSLAGRLTLPYVDAEQRLQFATLEIPTSGAFTQDDLSQLWLAGRRMAEWQSRRARPEELDFASPTIVGSNEIIVDWYPVSDCAHHARQLLAAWPFLLDKQLVWAPVGLPLGVEDILITEANWESRSAPADMRDQRPTQSARWIGRRKPWVSATLAAVAQAVVNTALASTPERDREFVRDLLMPISAVAVASAALAPASDLDPSSWPATFGSFMGSCLRVLAELEAAERGAGAIPLLDTDELYEAWLALTVWRLLDDMLGPSAPGDSSTASWRVDGGVVELWIKPTFLSAEPLRIGTESFCAVGAQRLVPDLLISSTLDGETSLVILDAKAWTTMQAEAALAEAAKYLYGIRFFIEDDRARVPVVARAELVTCAVAPTISSPEVVHLGVATATPTQGADSLEAVLIRCLQNLHVLADSVTST